MVEGHERPSPVRLPRSAGLFRQVVRLPVRLKERGRTMSRRIALQATKIALALVLLVLAAPASHASFDAMDVPGYYLKEDQATWAAYYRSHARVRLGPEQRLANGVSWRLHIDVGTRLAMPRITWMPDARRIWTANAMFDMAQGGAMLVSRAAGRELDEEQT